MQNASNLDFQQKTNENKKKGEKEKKENSLRKQLDFTSNSAP